jgi:hypothetical protein
MSRVLAKKSGMIFREQKNYKNLCGLSQFLLLGFTRLRDI